MVGAFTRAKARFILFPLPLPRRPSSSGWFSRRRAWRFAGMAGHMGLMAMISRNIISRLCSHPASVFLIRHIVFCRMISCSSNSPTKMIIIIQ